MSDCGCKPGAHSDGWQERRSEDCDRAEVEAWGRAVEIARSILGKGGVS